MHGGWCGSSPFATYNFVKAKCEKIDLRHILLGGVGTHCIVRSTVVWLLVQQPQSLYTELTTDYSYFLCILY